MVTVDEVRELGGQVRALARRRQVQRQVGPGGRWTELEPDLRDLADRCEEYGWVGRGREDLDTLAAAARAALAAE